MKRKFYSWEACLQLKEVQALKALKHKNIIKLREVIRESNSLYFVFEYMEENLYERLRARHSFFSESTVFNMIRQVLEGLNHIHEHGYFHRDVKPENILCKGDIIKIADLGLAKEIRSLPPYTEYVSTRWYRAPELLLHAKAYTATVDLWAVGCIIYELLTGQPLFPGKTEVDQLMKICSILGSPNFQNPWPDADKLAYHIGFSWPTFTKMPLLTRARKINKTISQVAIKLIEDILRFNPMKRISASALLHLPVLNSSCVGSAVPSQEQGIESFGLFEAKPIEDENNNSHELNTDNIHALLGQLESQYYSAEDGMTSSCEISEDTSTDKSADVIVEEADSLLHSSYIDPLTNITLNKARDSVAKTSAVSSLQICGQNDLQEQNQRLAKLPKVRIVSEHRNDIKVKRRKFQFPRLKSPKRLFFQTITGTHKQQQDRKRPKRSWPSFLSYRKHQT